MVGLVKLEFRIPKVENTRPTQNVNQPKKTGITTTIVDITGTSLTTEIAKADIIKVVLKLAVARLLVMMSLTTYSVFMSNLKGSRMKNAEVLEGQRVVGVETGSTLTRQVLMKKGVTATAVKSMIRKAKVDKTTT